MTLHPDSIYTRDTLVIHHSAAAAAAVTSYSAPKPFFVSHHGAVLHACANVLGCCVRPASRPLFLCDRLASQVCILWLCTVIYDLMLKSNTVDAHHHRANVYQFIPVCFFISCCDGQVERLIYPHHSPP